MENLLKDLSTLMKSPNDSIVQLKTVSLLADLLDKLKKAEKRKVTEIQTQVEEALYTFINSNRVNSDISARYIYYIFQYLFDSGLGTRLNEFISKLSATVTSSKMSTNTKGTAIWLMGKVCAKSSFKTQFLTDLLNLMIKTIKNTSELLIKNECFANLSRLLHLKLPTFYNSLNDILKIVLKQEKYFSSEAKCKRNILKTLEATIFYLNASTISHHYESVVNFLTKCFEDDDSGIRTLAVNCYVGLHTEKVFEPQITLSKILRKKPGELLKNFLEVLLYLGNLIQNKTDLNLNVKIAYIHVLKILFNKNMEFLNTNESLILKVYDFLIIFFQLNFTAFNSNTNLNYKNNFNTMNTPNQNILVQINYSQQYNQNKFNNEVESLYRTYIKIIYHASYRKSLLKHIFKRLQESQSDLDNIENKSNSITMSPTKIVIDKKVKKEREKYTEYQVNAMLLSLIEISEHNYDIFEINYKTFNELSQLLMVYLISSVRSFRMLINRVLINFAYFIPAWRIAIITLVLNLTSVSHAEVASFKNTFIYFVEETSPDYKYALIIRNNIDLLKDISNCLAVVLSMYSHKHHGVTIDLSNAALITAKNMIIGKFADEEDNLKSLSLAEKTARFDFSNSDIDSHKEAGWIIIQGLCSMDYTWLTNNYKTLFQLWKYIFAEHCCIVEEAELAKPEYRESLISEFFIKKAALSALRKFILAAADFKHTTAFQAYIPKFLASALLFFVPYEKKKVLSFYKYVLKDKYKALKSVLYDCFYNLPIKLYQSKFNTLLYPLCDEITSVEYYEYSLEFIYCNLNFVDTFMCEKVNSAFNPNQVVKMNSNNCFDIEYFTIEKFDILLTDRLNTDINSKIIDSSSNLLIEILLDVNLSSKNRQLIFKHFLTHMNEMNMKQIEKGRLHKVINIIYALFMILQKAYKKNIHVINDESIFASSKMIFDIGLKIDNVLTRRLSAEGHALLIKASANPQANIKYYLTAMECKFKNELNIDNQQFVTNFYMVANIFRLCEFGDILPIIDDFMNFIISYFNKIEDLFNPFISQSILIITDVLIKSKSF
jgi:hypothetical protein